MTARPSSRHSYAGWRGLLPFAVVVVLAAPPLHQQGATSAAYALLGALAAWYLWRNLIFWVRLLGWLATVLPGEGSGYRAEPSVTRWSDGTWRDVKGNVQAPGRNTT